MKILRYTIPAVSGRHEVEMPHGAHILRVRQKPNEWSTISIWAIVNPEANKVMRTFRGITTDETFEKAELDEMKYLNTVFPTGNQFALHIFEVLL